MLKAFTEGSLLDALARGEIVVLPNRRATGILRNEFERRQRAAGHAAWQSPSVLTWSDWVRGLWTGLVTSGQELRLLLNAAQEHSLWREIIVSSTTGKTLTSPDALAEMAASAYALTAAHLATASIRPAANTFDSRTFAGWAEAFAKTIAAERSIPAALLEEALCRHAQAGALRFDEPVLIAGFEQMTPAQAKLIEELREAGANITAAALQPETTGETGGRVSTVVPASRDELMFAARWIRSRFERGEESGPGRVAVLLTRPEERRAEIESVFREVLAPELESIVEDTSAAPWEFVGGSALATQPMIVDALALIHLVQGALPIERLSALLRSPFIGVEQERLAAARFDAQVLRRGPYLLPEHDLEGLGRLVRLQSGKPSGYSPGWLRSLNDLRGARLRSSASRSYGEWAEFIREILRTANWPGDRQPTASEFACARAWDAMLDLLATLDFRGARVGFSAALKTMNELVQKARVRQPAAAAPVQIMRPEDTEGSIFDAVVLLGATDESWPESARPHPFLGWPLQHQLGLPGCEPSRDVANARARMESLLGRSGSVLALSTAAGESGPNRPSPLLEQLGIVAVAADELLEPMTRPATIAEEVLPDEIALPELPSRALRGGAGVLRLQAACGFLAFAEMRLRAAAVDGCELGLDAGERGSLVHRALESFWTSTRSQAELRGLTTEERNQRLEDAISMAFAKLPQPAAGWSSSYIRVQRERLRRLLSAWLDVELTRGPFTVQQREERSVVAIGPLQLKVQPDRIDEVEGGVVLVDYKTGYQAHRSNWNGERPDDPQLPLYALLTEPGKLQALLFARVRPGSEMEWHGLAADRSVLPSARRQQLADLELRREEWQNVLTKLADDFAAGKAQVDPKSFTVNCAGCAQRLLCRVDPRTLVSGAADEEEEEIDV